MFVSEIYQSRQGEGRLTGTPSVFLRTSGCNLRCWFCDTPYASWQPEGETQSIEEVLNRIEQVAGEARHVVITGGEPLLARDLVETTERLKRLGYHITIETAGTIFRDLACDLISISPKLSNSDPDAGRAGEWQARHQRTRHRPELVRQWIQYHDYQLKFVVDHPDDLLEIEQYLEQIQPVDAAKVLLMPQGIDATELQKREAWLGPACDRLGFTLCRRLHIVWYGNRRGT